MEYRITKAQIENDLLYETLKALYEGMKAIGLPLYIVGGTARDFSRAILGTDKPARVTTDLDVAIAIRDWSVFDKISAELTHLLTEEHRLFYHNQIVSELLLEENSRLVQDLVKYSPWNDAYQIIRRALNDFASILGKKDL